MSKNYFSNFDINKGTFGFSLFNTSFVNNVPTTITSGAGGLTLSVVGGGLRNKVSLELNKPGAINTQGQGLISDVLTLDRADLARVLRFAFEFERTAGTIDASGTATSSFEVWIYDVTNNQWIQPSGFRGITQITLPGTCSGEFQPPSTALALRLAIIYRQTDTNLWTMRFDEFELLQQSRARGAVVTDWQSAGPITITATVNPTKGTTTVDRVLWRREGDSAVLRYEYNQTTAGTAGTGTYLHAIPSFLQVDTAKLSTATGFGPRIVGRGVLDQGSAASAAQFEVIYETGNTLSFQALNTVGGSPSFTPKGSAYSALNQAANSFSAEVRVPIAGWSSNVQVSSDTDTRVVSFVASKGGAQAITANVTNITFANILKDTHAAWVANDTYRVPVSGDYYISTSGGSSSAVNISVWKNGINTGFILTGFALDKEHNGSLIISDLRAGDLITLRGNQNVTINGQSLTISRISGPSQIAASETVAVSARNNSGQSIPNNTETLVSNWTEVLINTHQSFSGGIFTAPISGKYLASCRLNFASTEPNGVNSFANIVHRRGSTVISAVDLPANGGGTLTLRLGTGSHVFDMQAGDTIRVLVFQNTGAARSLAPQLNINVLSIVKVG